MGLKKISIFFLFLLLHSGLGAAESVRLLTDKNVYVAGDFVWCSAVCESDGAEGRYSAIAYVELVSREGVAATAKIALIAGKGSGVLALPSNIPTGNYKIFAYTALSEHAETQDIAVFNTMSGTRVRGGVVLCDDPLASPASVRDLPEGVELNLAEHGNRTEVSLRNSGGSARMLCVSVVEDDGLRCAESAPQYVAHVKGEAETDGEIVRASVYGKDAGKLVSRPWLVPVISSPGSAADTYTGRISPDGTISFRTNNIYGERDLVCEIFDDSHEGLECYFSPVSPFFVPEGLEFSTMRLSTAMRSALTARNSALALEARVDTLYRFLPKRDNLLLSDEDRISYHLDDYTRFNTIEDIIRELIPYARVRTSGKNKSIKMYGSKEDALVMLDGVPVSDHRRIFAYDALALRDVYVYKQMYVMGNTVFCGIINFVTSRNDMSALAFDNNVRILDFQGCSYPLALDSSALPPHKSAGRTLVWQPCVEIDAGQSISFAMPSTSAPLIIKVKDL